MGRPKGSKNKETLPETSEASHDILVDSPVTNLFAEENVKVTYDETKKVLVTELPAQSVFNLYERMPEVNRNFLGYNEEYAGPKGQLFSDTQERQSFAGGKHTEILEASKGKFNKEGFVKQRAALQKTFQKLEFLEQQIARKRIRKMSEHDGELDFDRLFDREPFFATKVTNNGIARTMEIFVDFTFSAGVNAEEINKYGSLCWGIVDLLEKSGIQCSVSIITQVSNGAYKQASAKFAKPIEEFRTVIKVKGTNDYSDTMDTARCFSTNFYRRGIFNTWVSTAESMKYEAHYGLGNVKHWTRQAKAEKGKLYLQLSQMETFALDHNALAKFIQESL